MSNTRINLRTGPIGSHLVRMTLPMIWGIAAMVSFQLVDTYYVSLLGTLPLAAMSFTFPVTFFVFGIVMGFGIAMSSVVSRLIGEGREEDVKRVTTHGLILVFLAGCLLALIGYIFRDAIFAAMGADESVRPLIHDYMTIWFAGAALMATPFVGNSAMRAAGSTMAPALIMVGVALLNAGLAPLLVFGLWGFPRLELQGAAIATVFSNFVAMTIGLYILSVRKKMILPFSNLHWDKFGDSCKRLLFIAIPAGLTSAINPVVNSVVIGLLAGYGAEAVAAFGIATRIEAFVFIILMALAVGMSPIIGQNFGARQFDRVHETLRKAIGFSVLWSIFIGAILFFLAEPVASLFSDDPIVIYYAKLSFLIIAPSYLFNNLINGWSSAFNAMGRPQISFAMTVAKMIALMIPAVLIGANIGGAPGIFIAIAAVNIATGVGFHFLSLYLCRETESAVLAKAEAV
jgi:putative MATE family efflux protein